MFRLLIFFSLLFCSHQITAQSLNYFLEPPKALHNDSAKLELEFNNLNFFKNNEYFNPFYEGYTLPGYFVKAKLHYFPVKSVKLSAGVLAQKYSGVKNFSEFLPIFSFQYNFSPASSLIFGTINNPVFKGFVAPIFDSEKWLTHNNQNGLEYTFHGKNFYSSTWIDWQQFIFQGASYPEKLLFGSSNAYIISPLSKQQAVKFIAQALISHIGGQIDNSTVSVETLANLPVGIDYKYRLGNKKSVQLKAQYITFADLSPTKKQNYILGYGVYSLLSIENRASYFALSHWFGNMFISPVGNPLFESSAEFSNYSEDKRAILAASYLLKKNIHKTIKIGLGADAYFDLYNKNLDYSFGVYADVNLSQILIAQ